MSDKPAFRSMGRPHQMQSMDVDVWTASHMRVRRAYELFDDVAVSFSGGKDSTATLHATLHVARELGRLPLKVFFLDEECIPWETVEYVERVARRDDIDMMWLCLPFKLRNACSRKSPHWWTWAPEDKDRWARPLPVGPWVVTELEGVTDVPVEKRPEFMDSIWRLFPGDRSLGEMLGIRTQESLMRWRMATMYAKDNYIRQLSNAGGANPYGNIHKVIPIYDWTTEDVWTAPAQFGWDYNRAYDLMEMHGIAHHSQRCSPAFGEEPIRHLQVYAECFPDVWNRMQERVPGVGAAYRYSRTELYSYGSQPEKPDGWSWGEFIKYWLDKHEPATRSKVAQEVRKHLNFHMTNTTDPLLPKTGHPFSGISWSFLLQIAMRGNLKGRKQPNAGTQERYDKELAEVKATGKLREWTTW